LPDVSTWGRGEQRPIKFEPVINRSAAKALGLEIAPMPLARARDVAE
jgi:hypothetical protein